MNTLNVQADGIYSNINVGNSSHKRSYSEFIRKRSKLQYQYFKEMITSFPTQGKISYFYQYINPEIKIPKTSAASLFKRIMDLSGLDRSASQIKASDKLNQFLSTNFKTVYLPGNVYTSYNNHLPKPFYRKELEAWAFDAVDNGDNDAIRGLLENFNLLDSEDESGNNLLVNAIVSNHNDIARMLIYRGISLDSVNKIGMTALMVAVQQGNQEMVSLLMVNGANPYYKDKNGKSAYSYALMGENQDIVKLMKSNMSKNSKRKILFKKKKSL